MEYQVIAKNCKRQKINVSPFLPHQRAEHSVRIRNSNIKHVAIQRSGWNILLIWLTGPIRNKVDPMAKTLPTVYKRQNVAEMKNAILKRFMRMFQKVSETLIFREINLVISCSTWELQKFTNFVKPTHLLHLSLGSVENWKIYSHHSHRKKNFVKSTI